MGGTLGRRFTIKHNTNFYQYLFRKTKASSGRYRLVSKFALVLVSGENFFLTYYEQQSAESTDSQNEIMADE